MSFHSTFHIRGGQVFHHELSAAFLWSRFRCFIDGFNVCEAGEGMGGSLFWKDLISLAHGVGFSTPFLVSASRIVVYNSELKAKAGEMNVMISEDLMNDLKSSVSACFCSTR